jgi:hypothetical protein
MNAVMQRCRCAVSAVMRAVAAFISSYPRLIYVVSFRVNLSCYVVCNWSGQLYAILGGFFVFYDRILRILCLY